jgi:MoaA/NifB/PqqE/SkfB family radical SAM enzyme
MMTEQIPPEVLERIWFYTNFDCSLRCRYCVAGSPADLSRAPLYLPAFQRMLGQAIALGFRQAALTGGEPLQHPDIVSMLAYATARLDTVVLTNALLLTEGILHDLEQTKRDHLTLQVSLDSADPEINDRLRGRGTWQKAVEGIEKAVEAGYKIAVRATLDGQDQEELSALRLFLETRGVPGEQVYGASVAKVGCSTHGVELSFASLCPEATVTSDGLYWHPLMIDPSTAVAHRVEPLEDSLNVLVEKVHEVKPVGLKGIR